MKILLDENITQKSIPILQKYKHDVIHILDRCNAGQSYERVFQLALKEQRVLITLNGKDFIVFIPPQTDLALHYGLIWIRKFQVTNKNYEEVMNIIGDFLKSKGNNIENIYYAMKKKGDSYEIIQQYPRSTRMFMQF